MSKLKITNKDDIFERTPFWVRWAAKIVVKWMNKDNTSSYQVSGSFN